MAPDDDGIEVGYTCYLQIKKSELPAFEASCQEGVIRLAREFAADYGYQIETIRRSDLKVTAEYYPWMARDSGKCRAEIKVRYKKDPPAKPKSPGARRSPH
jgi:hypothetical protein